MRLYEENTPVYRSEREIWTYGISLQYPRAKLLDLNIDVCASWFDEMSWVLDSFSY